MTSGTRRDGNGKPVQGTTQVLSPTKSTGNEVTKTNIGSRARRVSTTVASAEDTQTRTEINVESESNERDKLRTKSNKKSKRLHKYKDDLASSRCANDALKSEILTVQNLLEQEQKKNTNLEKRLGEIEVSLKSQRTQTAKIMKDKRRYETLLEESKAELSFTQDARDKLKRQLIVAQHSLQQERDEKADVAANLRKFKTLLKSERAQRKEIEESKTRCEAVLEEHISRHLLGVRINIQGAYQTLPEIEAAFGRRLRSRSASGLSKEAKVCSASRRVLNGSSPSCWLIFSPSVNSSSTGFVSTMSTYSWARLKVPRRRTWTLTVLT